MKGAVFIALNEMVESVLGISGWEQVLEEVKPECNGVYTSTLDYPDGDITRYVMVISGKLEITPEELTRKFGTYLFKELNQKYPHFSRSIPVFFDFLNSIENIIHKEVRKLYENPGLPHLQCELINEHQMEIYYTSPRKLCYLAEGLIMGAAEYYKKDITLKQDECLHAGNDRCRFNITVNG